MFCAAVPILFAIALAFCLPVMLIAHEQRFHERITYIQDLYSGFKRVQLASFFPSTIMHSVLKPLNLFCYMLRIIFFHIVHHSHH